MTVTEQELWFILDTIAVKESAMGGNKEKSAAAVAMMGYLHKPSPSECKHLYAQGYGLREAA